MFSTHVQKAIDLAWYYARTHRHEYVTVEHLLYGLLVEPETFEILEESGANVSMLLQDVSSFLETNPPSYPTEAALDTQESVGFQRVLHRAFHHAQIMGLHEILAPHVLVAMFDEDESFAVFLMERNSLHRYQIIWLLSQKPLFQNDPFGDDDSEPWEPSELPPEMEEIEESDQEARKDPLKSWTSNLNDLAEQGRIDELIGREEELERVIQILARRRKNNPLLVGDSGVGKTALAEGLALRIVQGQIPEELQEAEVFSLDMGSLLAGTRFRGDFEARLKSLLKAIEQKPHAILFIDEIHTIIGAGSVSGSAMDASNLLKPALAAGRLRCIGSTSFKEYRSHFEKDRALARRFQKIDISEPSVEDSIKILHGLRPSYEDFHRVSITDEAIKKAVELSARYLHDRRLPDKAIDLMDEAAAMVKLTRVPDGLVDGIAIEKVLAKLTQIPPQEIDLDDRARLRRLRSDLGSVVFGQDEALDAVVAAVKLARAGLSVPEKPIASFLFTGPTGVGKTEVARQIAKTLGIELIRFDMSEYMERHAVSRLIGAPPGYVGFEQGGLLTDAVTKTPHAVLLLDEIEKAHPDVFNLLLQVMDYGRLTDNNGRLADFRQILLIMTSNVGARDLTIPAIGFQKDMSPGSEDRAFKDTFSPEFRNRLDARIRFHSLKPAIIEKIVEKLLDQLSEQLLPRRVEMMASSETIGWLAKHGYDALMGARPLARLLREAIKQPLSEAILFGELKEGGHVEIDVEDDRLSFHYHSFAAQETQEVEAIKA